MTTPNSSFIRGKPREADKFLIIPCLFSLIHNDVSTDRYSMPVSLNILLWYRFQRLGLRQTYRVILAGKISNPSFVTDTDTGFWIIKSINDESKVLIMRVRY